MFDEKFIKARMGGTCCASVPAVGVAQPCLGAPGHHPAHANQCPTSQLSYIPRFAAWLDMLGTSILL